MYGISFCLYGVWRHIYNEKGETADKEFRVEQMKKVWSTPKNSSDTEEKAWAFMQKILNRQTFESVCDVKEIEENEAAGDKKSADSYRFIALYSMISYGITGFCPDLVDKGEELNEKIREYIGCLR